MAVRVDVAVIGAGAFGLSVALHCALRGRSVAVVERKTAGSQASRRAAGLFKSVQADPLRDEAEHSRGWGVELAGAEPRTLGERASYYQPAGDELAIWCPEDAYIEEPSSLIDAYLAAGHSTSRIGPFAPSRFGPVADEHLVSKGAWEYAHFYGPADA
jgi:hypothetical protein